MDEDNNVTLLFASHVIVRSGPRSLGPRAVVWAAREKET